MRKSLAALSVLLYISVFLFVGCDVSPGVSPTADESPSVSAQVTEPPDVTVSPASKEESDPYGDMTNEEIRNRIENRYGITVIWGGEEVSVEAGPPWDELPCLAPGLLRKSLIILDEQLALYPEGFFNQMTKPYFILAEWIRTTDGTVQGYADYGKGYTAIFVTTTEDMLEVLDWYGDGDIVAEAAIDFQSTLHHEIGHTIFRMTGFDGANVFDFDKYFELLPDDFIPPANIYDDEYRKYIPADDVEQVYFCSLYAMSNPMEFMAELFCLSMKPSLNWTFASPNVQAQLGLFCKAIRDAYDTDNWPEQTYWERALR